MNQSNGDNQVWLRGNRRASTVLLLIAVAMIAVGIVLGFQTSFVRIVGWTLVAIGTAWAILQMRELLQPRLAVRNDRLLVYTGGWRPHQVPIDVVEVFFLGQGPSTLSRTVRRPIENSTVVIRIAEAAAEWQKRPTNRRIAHWCEGYITLRGMWCEPLTVEKFRQLNHSLIEIKRRRKQCDQTV